MFDLNALKICVATLSKGPLILLFCLAWLSGTVPSAAKEQSPQNAERFEIIAHRGLHVMWKKGSYDRASGCEARHIYPPTHDYIENTLPSMAKAFELGATMVELDIRPSKDQHLMVIHEYDLACKTNGTGLVSEHNAADLKSLDLGYGFTHDQGQTYPLRGKGLGLMPTLPEVLMRFPDKKFLIHHKDGSRETADLLIQLLKTRSPEHNRLLFYWGPKETHQYIAKQIPELRRLFPNKEEIKACLMPYLLSAGMLGFQAECAGQNIGINRHYAQKIWGWPELFLQRARENHNPVFAMVDSAEEAAFFKDLPLAGIVTDHIDTVAPYYTQGQAPAP